MCNILIFGGTLEGRRLCEYLSQQNIQHSVSIATEYGKNLLNNTNSQIFVGRLNRDEIIDFINRHNFSLIIDATHPYATEVTQNIKYACNNLQIEYIRLLRESQSFQDVLNFPTTEAAVEYLNSVRGKVLLTTGSKDLPLYTKVMGFENRLFPRILPTPEVLQSCLALGYSPKNIVCMQGPFSHDINVSMLKQFDCGFLVTKDSGETGGLEAKITAANEAGAKVILIQRPLDEVGYTYEHVISLIRSRFEQKHEFFPLFIPIKSKTVLVVGGGEIAQRRIMTLLNFDCNIKVVAPKATEKIRDLANRGLIDFINEAYLPNHPDGAFMVIAATDNREVNHSIGVQAKEKGLWVSVADCKEECNFFFPGVITHDGTVMGLTSGGQKTKELKAFIQRLKEVLE